jgi:hypothetical protein
VGFVSDAVCAQDHDIARDDDVQAGLALDVNAHARITPDDVFVRYNLDVRVSHAQARSQRIPSGDYCGWIFRSGQRRSRRRSATGRWGSLGQSGLDQRQQACHYQQQANHPGHMLDTISIHGLSLLSNLNKRIEGQPPID